MQTNNAHVIVEPYSSEGPEALPDGWWQGLAHSERVSMNLSLFHSGRGWRLREWEKEGTSSRRTLKRESLPRTKMNWHLSERDAQVLGTLWAHQGSPLSRHALFKRVLVVSKKSSGVSAGMLTRGGERVPRPVLSTLYHPSLEYSGLPELVVLALGDERKAKILKTVHWLETHMPYVRTRYGDTSLVAHIRVPWGTSLVLPSIIQERIGKKCIVLLAKQTLPQYMTLPSRLYNFNNREWNDPWVEER